MTCAFSPYQAYSRVRVLSPELISSISRSALKSDPGVEARRHLDRLVVERVGVPVAQGNRVTPLGLTRMTSLPSSSVTAAWPT